MDREQVIQGQRVSSEDIAMIMKWLAEFPDWDRTRLSRELCTVWNWHNGAGRLKDMANQARFLILPWVRVPHLSSHLLNRSAARLSADWRNKYGHPIWLVETFVERDRFEGTCYRAAGWLPAGPTTGRTRNNKGAGPVAPVKEVYLKPLRPDWKRRLAS